MGTFSPSRDNIGGTSVKAVAVTREGELLATSCTAFDPHREMAFAETARRLLRELQDLHGEYPPPGNKARRGHEPHESPHPPFGLPLPGGEGRGEGEAPIYGKSLRAVGVCAPGLAAGDQRSIAHLPERLPGICGLDWTVYLEASSPVPVLNDAQAALLAETWLGAAKGKTNVILLTLGTGVGGAAMVDGRLLRGHLGRAGHFGHISLDPHGPPDICQTPGSLEDAIGNCTIARRSNGRFATTHELVRAHLAGDAKATEIWHESVRALAAGVVSLGNVLDPEVVLIGGGIAASGEALFEPLRAMVSQMEWRIDGHAIRVAPAALGEMAGAFGAASNALQVND